MSVLIAIAKSIQLEDLKLLSTSQNLFRTSELVVTTSKVYFSTRSIRKYWIPWCKDLSWISKRPESVDSSSGLLVIGYYWKQDSGKISTAHIEVSDRCWRQNVLVESFLPTEILKMSPKNNRVTNIKILSRLLWLFMCLKNILRSNLS